MQFSGRDSTVVARGRILPAGLGLGILWLLTTDEHGMAALNELISNADILE